MSQLYGVGALKNHPIDTVLLSTHNIWFDGEKNIFKQTLIWRHRILQTQHQQG